MRLAIWRAPGAVDDVLERGNPYSINLLNRARSASGKGADMLHPPKKENSQNQLNGKPCVSGFRLNTLFRSEGSKASRKPRQLRERNADLVLFCGV